MARDRAAAPLIRARRKTQNFSVRLDQNLLMELKQFAQQHGLSTNALIDQLLNDAFERAKTYGIRLRPD